MQNGKDHTHVFVGRISTSSPSHLQQQQQQQQNGHTNSTNVVVSSSPPHSPANSPRLRSSGRSLNRTTSKVKPYSSSSPFKGSSYSRGFHGSSPHSFLQKLTLLLLGLFFKRHRLLLLVPFVYVAGMMLYMGSEMTMPEFPPFPGRYRPGSVYRSDQVFAHLWPAMESNEAAAHGVSVSAIPVIALRVDCIAAKSCNVYCTVCFVFD